MAGAELVVDGAVTAGDTVDRSLQLALSVQDDDGQREDDGDDEDGDDGSAGLPQVELTLERFADFSVEEKKR